MNYQRIMRVLVIVTSLSLLMGCGEEKDPSYAGAYAGSMTYVQYKLYAEEDYTTLTSSAFYNTFSSDYEACNIAQTSEGNITMVVTIGSFSSYLTGRIQGNTIVFPLQILDGAEYTTISGSATIESSKLVISLLKKDYSFEYSYYTSYKYTLTKL